jgi:peptidyl-prolyl cis-trans isomerase A (cyclophilin A)
MTIRSLRHLKTVATVLTLFAAIPAQTAKPPAKPAGPATVTVNMLTSDGPILIQLETKRAPITSANFLRYVDRKYLDGTTFYRAARAKGSPKTGFIQGGINGDATRWMPPIPHEPTTTTGLHHGDGTISMARTDPGTAAGEFFMIVGAAPYMDANPRAKGDKAGYAAFGHVVKGMDVVRRILASPTYPKGGPAEMKGQMIKAPVRIISVRRVS